MVRSAVSRAAILLSSGGDEPDTDGLGLFALSVRLPSLTASLVASMADQAGRSRNEILNLIVDAGVEAILSATDPEVVADLHRESHSNLVDFIS